MGVEAVISTQVIDTTTVGRSLMTAANAAAARSALSLGTLATQNGTISDYLTAAAAAFTYQTILVSGTSIKTVNGSSLLGSGDLTVSGLSGTGSVDNAVLRADGTGGSTLQSSAIVIDDLFTVSPNNTVNFVCLKPTGGTTNVGVAIVPKGTGAFALSVPDGTSTGGNSRGANSIDLQTTRTTAAQVASGSPSVAIGASVTASGTASVALGRFAIASGAAGFAVGDNLEGTGSLASGLRGSVAFAGGQATGREAVAIGYNCTASGANTSLSIGNGSTASGNFSATAIGNACTASGNITQAIGNGAVSDRTSMYSRAAGTFAAAGDAQQVAFVLRNKTTNNTATTLFADGSSARLTIPSGKVLSALCRICGIKSDGTAVANYVRRVVIKNLAGTTSLVGAVETIGTDIEDNAATDVAITADNTNDALQINVTGITGETWRWVAVVEGLEIAYGT